MKGVAIRFRICIFRATTLSLPQQDHKIQQCVNTVTTLLLQTTTPNALSSPVSSLLKQSMLLCGNPRLATAMHPRKTTRTRSLKIAMVPNRRKTFFSAASSPSIYPEVPRFITATDEFNPVRTAHPEDPNLNWIPPSLKVSYQPIPFGTKLLIGIISMVVMTKSIWKQIEWILLVRRVPHTTARLVHWWSRHLVLQSLWFLPRTLLFRTLLKGIVMYFLTCTLLQDLIPKFQPSRISTAELMSRFFLPSNLSNYATPSDDMNHRVHWLALGSDRTNGTLTKPIDIVYLNHGFGASSLSWLPVMPRLATSVACQVVLGHDAPGFGFTDRPENNLTFYSIQNSAAIGTTLLHSLFGEETEKQKRVLLMGHSMGCLTTLSMAAQLDPSVTLHVVLVAPALGLRPEEKGSKRRLNEDDGTLTKQGGFFLTRFLGSVVSRIASYGLRRLVGRPNFWRAGMQLAWGDKARLSESDVLRYEWPSIGQGWERGLLWFARSQASGQTLNSSDEDLLQAVLGLPNICSVDVILGSNDRIVKQGIIREFFRPFPQVTLTEMEGLGHNPFEEDCEGFMEILQRVLRERCGKHKQMENKRLHIATASGGIV